jgi:histidinol-phosphate aminotransferase
MSPLGNNNSKKCPRLAERVAGVKAYRSLQPTVPVDLCLNSNEGRAPDPTLLNSLELHGRQLLNRYPDASGLEAALAKRLRIDSANVMVTAGGDDAIDRVCRAFCAPGRELIQCGPTFEMIARYARLAGAEIVSVDWTQGAYPLEQVISRVSKATAVIAVVSPNNPNGFVVSATELERLAACAQQAVLLVDLAYTEFADQDLTDTALGLSNAVVVRTFSKAWGLAGLRVGYAAASAEIIEAMRAAGHPYPVGRPSLALATTRLQAGDQAIAPFIKRVRLERTELSDLLSSLGAEPFASQANFVLARFRDAAWVSDGLAALGISVRSFNSDKRLQGCLRITCPGEELSFEKLKTALKTVLAPRALLLDMDGVLADVSNSYRQTIIDTAQTFGLALSYEEVRRAKSQTGANNDWQTTQRLLKNNGIETSFSEVKTRFEKIYQGTPEKPGLRKSESLIPKRAVLERLAARLKLAVVTGRPRKDAMRFLNEFGLTDLMQEVICLEDAPLKPDPAPVRLALSRLGIEQAWMVGDTPDDMSAARTAGVVPLGIRAPMDQDAQTNQALKLSGAARIVEDLAEIEEIA